MIPFEQIFSPISLIEDEKSKLEKKVSKKNISGNGIILHSVSRGTDNGANDDCSRAMGIKSRHSTTKEAFDNLVAGVKPPKGIIDPGPPIFYDTYVHMFCLWGHGSPGGFDTGSGNSGYGFINRMSAGSYANWQPIVKDLGNQPTYDLTTLRLYSCSTGAGTQGAAFIYDLACQIKCAVRARTGEIIWVRNGNKVKGYYEKGSVWQNAWWGDDAPPEPIYQPNHFETFKKFKTNKFDHGVGKELKLENATIISSKFIIYQNDNVIEKNFDSKDSELLSLLLFATPLFQNPGTLLAFISIQVVLNYSNNSILNIDIYNDRLGHIKEQNCSFFISDQLLPQLLK